MLMQRKTLFIIVIIIIVAFGIWLITYVQRMAKIPILIADMGDRDFEIAGDAMDDLVKYGPRVVPALSEVVRGRAEDPVSRARAAQLMGMIGSDRAVDTLLAVFDEPSAMPGERDLEQWQQQDELRWNAAIALGRIGSTKAISPLEDHMTNPDESLIVRISCVRALALLGSAGSVNKMIPILNDRPPFPEPEEEKEAEEEASAAEEGAEAEAEEEEEPQGEPTPLRVAVCQALSFLGRKGGPEVAALIAAATREDIPVAPAVEPDLAVVQWACYALGDIGDPAAKDILVANLTDAWVDENEDDIDDDTDADVRIAAAYALGRLGLKEVIPDLQRCLKDKSYWVRAAAFKSLKQLGGKVPEGKYAAPIQ